MALDLELKNNEVAVPSPLPGGFFIYNAKGNEDIVYVDENIVSLYGCDSIEDFRDFTNNSFRGMVHPDDYNDIQTEICKQNMFGEKQHDYVRYRIKTKSGEVKYVEDFGHLLHGVNGTSFYYVYIVDMDQDAYYNREDSSLAEQQVLNMNQETDNLTGIWNMGHFFSVVQEKINDPKIREHGLSIIYLDIDNFKLFNEKYGFKQGDMLLFNVARILWHSFLDRMAARFSDDHFVVATMTKDLEPILEKVREDICSLVEGVHLEINIGIYKLEDSCNDIGLACDHARLACKSIKNRYDLSFAYYNEELNSLMHRQGFIINNIDEAIKNGYIKPFYQPVIRVSTGEICGYEALARWVDPEKGILAPGEFIETLEKFHLIYKVDSSIIRQVCEEYKRLKEAGEPLVPFSINLSRLDFDLCNIFEVVDGYRRDNDMPVNMLDIEVTESALSDDTDLIKNELKKFREAGYQIWIDDFGSGYSSLTELLAYDFDLLKLDLTFLRNYDKIPKTGTLIEFIVVAAENMGVVALTEGVEKEEHFQFLKKIGCDKAQGYYFGKPQPMNESREFTRGKGLVWEKTES
ncbi:MAG: GGDEF and EAL domain-containing protein [Lachnospiraceae bacterium]|nr:GGDEF and EAL domain-containing protein [Lachnospiraceae bacterium]